MSKVLFTYTSGRERLMSPREAEVLSRLRRGSYMARDMRAQVAFPGTSDRRTCEQVHAYIKAENAKITADPLETMDASALHGLAKERGIKVHHNAGADKVRAALREAQSK